MTTITYRNRVMAADSRATRNGVICPERVQKLHRLKDGSLFGWVGDAGVGVRVRDRLNEPRRTDEIISTDGGALIFRPDGTLWTYESGALLPILHAPYYAIGSGKETAFGAMAMGAGARRAVSVAMQFDCYSGGDVTWLRL